MRGGKVERLTAADIQPQPRYEGEFRFAGVEDQFFVTAAVPSGEQARVDYRAIDLPVAGNTAGLTRSFIAYAVTTDRGATPSRAVTIPFFIGPKDIDVLSAVDSRLDNAIDFGMFHWLVRPLLRALKWINRFVHNYGWSIVVLTILINLAIFPLRHRSMVSMRKMQALQPEVKAIQDRYAKYKLTDPERQKMNTEMMALYKQKGVNPASGCLPMLLTMPILFAFYAMLSVAIELRGRAVLRLDPRPLRERSALHHARRHGRDDVLAAVADAVNGRSDAEADLHADADHFHVHLPRLPRGSGDLLAGQQPDGDRPAAPHQSPARAAAAGAAGRGQGRGLGHDRQADTKGPVMSDLDAKVIDFVRQVTGAMGLSLDVTVEETPDNIRLNLGGDGADALLRRKGEALDALQVIVNTAFRRDARGDRHYVVDALGFRKGKDAELRQMAQFLMEKVRNTGQLQELGPLNPYARRIVHLTVAEDETLTSESVGDAFLKSVVISRKV